MDTDPQEYVAVWSTTDNFLLPLVRSVLEAAGIPHIVQGEGAHNLFPMGAAGSQSTFRLGLAATILVARGRKEEAEQLIRETAETEEI